MLYSDVMVMCNCNRVITHSLVIVIVSVIGKLEHNLIGNRNCLWCNWGSITSNYMHVVGSNLYQVT